MLSVNQPIKRHLSRNLRWFVSHKPTIYPDNRRVLYQFLEKDIPENPEGYFEDYSQLIRQASDQKERKQLNELLGLLDSKTDKSSNMLEEKIDWILNTNDTKSIVQLAKYYLKSNEPEKLLALLNRIDPYSSARSKVCDFFVGSLIRNDQSEQAVQLLLTLFASKSLSTAFGAYHFKYTNLPSTDSFSILFNTLLKSGKLEQMDELIKVYHQNFLLTRSTYILLLKYYQKVKQPKDLYKLTKMWKGPHPLLALEVVMEELVKVGRYGSAVLLLISNGKQISKDISVQLLEQLTTASNLENGLLLFECLTINRNVSKAAFMEILPKLLNKSVEYKYFNSCKKILSDMDGFGILDPDKGKSVLEEINSNTYTSKERLPYFVELDKLPSDIKEQRNLIHGIVLNRSLAGNINYVLDIEAYLLEKKILDLELYTSVFLPIYKAALETENVLQQVDFQLDCLINSELVQVNQASWEDTLSQLTENILNEYCKQMEFMAAINLHDRFKQSYAGNQQLTNSLLKFMIYSDCPPDTIMNFASKNCFYAHVPSLLDLLDLAKLKGNGSLMSDLHRLIPSGDVSKIVKLFIDGQLSVSLKDLPIAESLKMVVRKWLNDRY
ncbi:hypothetical protein BC833DRAFT_571456 [Globomyces pollinis-pini]|nr:hypothetical protein BC833DRAFT_571456 [Globomyces pollinis-pini]